MSLLLLHLIQAHWTINFLSFLLVPFLPISYTVTFCAKNWDHSASPHELDTSLTRIPSHSTEGETWTPFCRVNFTARQNCQATRLSAAVELTCVLEFISNRYAAIRCALVSQEVPESFNLITRDTCLCV